MKTTLLGLCLALLSASGIAQQRISFPCDKVAPNTQLLPSNGFRAAIEAYQGQPIEAFDTTRAYTNIIEAQFHPFFFALHSAYAEHYPLTLSPDMIWLLIAQGMGQQINNNAELRRQGLVKHTGQKLISIDTRLYGDFVKGKPNSPWNKLTPVFADSIRSATHSDFLTAMLPAFSTTTPNETTAYEITLMNSVQRFFRYEVSTMCGIPEIVLEGSPADWKKIQQHARLLKKFGAEEWIDALEPILEQFVAASQGKAKVDFWQNIYKRHDASGGPYITGWITKFLPYVGKNDLRPNPYITKDPVGVFAGITTAQLPTGIAAAPFRWLYFDQSYDMAFASGFIGVEQHPETRCLRPIIGWYVYEPQPLEADNE